MKKHYFLIQKLLLFLFYLQSMIIMQAEHKQYFWLVAGLVSIVSYVFEGARPYTPLFIFIFIADLLDMTILQTICVVVLGFLMVYLKFYHIQIVGKGPYNAGYRIFKQNDITISIFYPSMSDGSHCQWFPVQQYKGALYDIFFVDPTKPRILPYRFFCFIVSFLVKLKMPVLGNATLYTNDSDKQQKWKVIVFSHGLGSNMNGLSSLCGWWASHGYIVVSVEHTHDTIRIQFGKQLLDQLDILQKLLYNSRNKDILVRAQQVQTILDSLTNEDLLGKVFKEAKKQMIIENIFLAGHSFGGGTMLQTKANLIRKNKDTPLIKGLVCLDAWFFPLSQTTYQTLKNQNILLLNSESFFSVVPSIYYMQDKMNRIRASNSQTLKAFVVNKTDHISICDFAFVFGNILKLIGGIKLQEHTKPVLQLHQIAISLFMEGKSSKQIIQICNGEAKKNGLLKKGVCLVQQWRYERQSKA